MKQKLQKKKKQQRINAKKTKLKNIYIIASVTYVIMFA